MMLSGQFNIDPESLKTGAEWDKDVIQKEKKPLSRPTLTN